MTDKKIAVSVAEASKMLGVSKPTMYNIVKSVGFPCLHIGGRILIPVEGMTEWVRQRSQSKTNC